MSPLLKKYFSININLVNKALKKYLPPASAKPQPIYESMRYSVFAGGKRLRPILVMAGAEACGGTAAQVLPTACAVELIHTYSLIHDDLPAMDNDDLRRGQPTNHKVFGDDIAILTGDALLTYAFQLMARNAAIKGVKPEAVVKAIDVMATFAGAHGMVGGQVADIKADKGRWKKVASPKALLKFIHMNKTAALIRASLVCGGILAGGTKKQIRALDKYGMNLGLAFQVTDDILDRVGDEKKLGKKGSDVVNQKLAYPAVYGLDTSITIARKLTFESKQALLSLENKKGVLLDLAEYVVERNN